MARIVSWGIALPSLRLPAKAYAAAWGSCAARGLVYKTVCAFDEDAVTLGAAAGRACLDRVAGDSRSFDALFVGATTLPYEEKPSSASILSMLTGDDAVRVVELRGSPQAGLQALASANDFCEANPGARALAIATDVPRAHPAAAFEHGLGAGAAAFLVSAGAVEGAAIERVVAVSHETFGSRLRRRGGEWREDLELRVNDDAASLKKLAAHFPMSGVKLATGLDPSLQRTAQRLFGASGADEQWASVGDLGTASAAVALADALGGTGAEGGIFAVAVGAGAIGLKVSSAPPGLLAPLPPLADLATGAVEIDYMRYLKESGFLARPGSAR
jgi:3-hydroxy-3-methylglutaryl CoA synthase